MKQSGDFTGTRMKMSKRGSPYLRRAIWLASTIAAFKDPAIHALYERKRSEGKDHMTVIGHICRKMVSIIFAVLRDNTPPMSRLSFRIDSFLTFHSRSCVSYFLRSMTV